MGCSPLNVTVQNRKKMSEKEKTMGEDRSSDKNQSANRERTRARREARGRVRATCRLRLEKDYRPGGKSQIIATEKIVFSTNRRGHENRRLGKA